MVKFSRINILLATFVVMGAIFMVGLRWFSQKENQSFLSSSTGAYSTNQADENGDSKEKVLLVGQEKSASDNQSRDLAGAPQGIFKKIFGGLFNRDQQPAQLIGDPDRNIFNSIQSQTPLNKPFSFAAIGDSESYQNKLGYNSGSFGKVLSLVGSQNPDMLFFTGDVISASADTLEGNRERIANIKNILDGQPKKYYLVFGNHDLEWGEACVDLWQEIFFGKKYQSGEKRDLYYSFDYQNTHFALLSSNYPLKNSVDDEQLAWLEEDLSKTSQENKIVFSHVPPVTFFNQSAKENHDMSHDPVQQGKLLGVIKKYKVDLVISGHEHAFDHKIVDGIDYVLSGNTGNDQRYKGTIKGDIYSMLYIDGQKIKLKALNTEGQLVREIQIK